MKTEDVNNQLSCVLPVVAAVRVAAPRWPRQLRWTVPVRATVVDWSTQNIH